MIYRFARHGFWMLTFVAYSLGAREGHSDRLMSQTVRNIRENGRGIATWAIFALGALTLHRLRLGKITRRLTIRFEERLAERTRIAEELHDTLLQGVVSASMQLHAAVEELPPDSPAVPPLGQVMALMTQVIDEGRHTLHGLRSAPSEPLNLEQAFSLIQREFPVSDELAFRVTVLGRPYPLNLLSRDEIYRIGREALINAFRHSKATKVDIEIKYAMKRLRLLVRDNGRGIDPWAMKPQADGTKGLAGMRERAARIGSRLRIWTSNSTGTEIELSVPSRIAYRFPPATRLRKWLFSGRQGSG